jgi:selenocysteine-specific elongation factor
MGNFEMEKEHVIVGTAGHIDHGKTSLVKALTGIDADTLPEEKSRGMTIELGFVFMKIPEYEKQIVFIDVPGHEKFVKTMAAGASNIDAALLVIAADEGISVQTREHFDILQLLGIETGLIALTKSDLVDTEMLSLVKEEISNFVKGTFLEGAPIIPVSSMTGAGVTKIKSELLEIGRKVRKRQDTGFFRMPVDRVFTMHGFGTVIAGTVLSSEVHVGDKVEIFPDKIIARVRGIQVHNQSREISNIGKRTALNLLDVRKEELRRGQCAARPGSLTPTQRLDTDLRLLSSYGKDLKNRERIRLHVGTDELIARVVLLGKVSMHPGEQDFVQFVLESPTVALPGDRFIIRTFSPLMTIGGGKILDATPQKHKRFDREVLEGLGRLEGNFTDIVEQLVIKASFEPQQVLDLVRSVGGREGEVREAVQKLAGEGKLVKIGLEKEEKYLHSNSFVGLYEKLVGLLTNYFQNFPYRMFMPLSDLRSQFLKLSDSQTFLTILDYLVAKKIVLKKDAQVSLAEHKLKLEPKEQQLSDRIEWIFKSTEFAPPLEDDVCRELGLEEPFFKKIMRSLYDQEKLVRLNPKVSYHVDSLKAAREIVLDQIQKKGSITIAELRDRLNLSRKYAQAVLEYFDQIGLTKRKEDRHELK